MPQSYFSGVGSSPRFNESSPGKASHQILSKAGKPKIDYSAGTIAPTMANLTKVWACPFISFRGGSPFTRLNKR